MLSYLNCTIVVLSLKSISMTYMFVVHKHIFVLLLVKKTNVTAS